MRTIRSKILIAMGWVMLISVIALGFFGIPIGIILCALIGLAYGVYKQAIPPIFFYRPNRSYRFFHHLLYTTSIYVNN